MSRSLICAGESVLSLLWSRRAVRDEEDAAIDKARALLQRVDLWKLADAPAGTLSGWAEEVAGNLPRADARSAYRVDG